MLAPARVFVSQIPGVVRLYQATERGKSPLALNAIRSWRGRHTCEGESMPIHPRLVHFPVALLIVGTGALLASWHPRARAWAKFGWITLLIGWLALFPAIITGLIDQSRAPQEPAITQTLNQHITAGLSLVVVYGYALYEWMRHRGELAGSVRWRVTIALLLGLGLLVLTGELGGRLVYVWNVGRAR